MCTLARKINSPISSLRELPQRERAALIAQLTDAEAYELLYDWSFWARPSQCEPEGNWFAWLLLAGRGFGKTRVGAEMVRARVESGKARRIAIVARTAADVRDVVVDGQSGIVNCCPPHFRPAWEPSKRRLTWPNGAVATTYSAEEPDSLRGPQHDFAWTDESASWKYPETWDMLMMGLRIGANPQVVVTTTPRPVSIIRDLIRNPDCVVTRGSTYDNRDNLAPKFFRQIIDKYEGTRLGRQELNAELLDDYPGALWQRSNIDATRVSAAPEMRRIVVAIDPATTSAEDSDETGIVVAGLGIDGHGYILADRSCRMSPDGWARRAVAAYREFKADRIIGEVNNGGDMIETVLRMVERGIPYRAVHASRGKITRAEPVAALYEQSRVHHIGTLDRLEDQMCAMLPDGYAAEGSPDRADAAVWALTELMVQEVSSSNVLEFYRQEAEQVANSQAALRARLGLQ